MKEWKTPQIEAGDFVRDTVTGKTFRVVDPTLGVWLSREDADAIEEALLACFVLPERRVVAVAQGRDALTRLRAAREKT